MKLTKIQITTIVLLLAYLIWEGIVWQWSKSEIGPIIRADLLLIYPILIIFILLSIYQWIKRKYYTKKTKT